MKKSAGIIFKTTIPLLVYAALLASVLIYSACDNRPNIESTKLIIIIILCLSSAALLFYFIQTIRFRISGENMKEAVSVINRKYHDWFESAADGTIFIPDSGSMVADQVIMSMLGYSSDEFIKLNPADLFLADSSGQQLLEGLKNKNWGASRFETRLIKKGGETYEVVITVSGVNSGNLKGTVLIIKNINDSVKAEALRINIEKDQNLIEQQSALQYIYHRAGNMMVEPLLLNENTLISEAVSEMNRHKVNSFIVVNDTGFPSGIVTDQDLRQRVLSGVNHPKDEVRTIMSSPVVTAPVDIMFFEAFRLMRDNSIRQLLIVSDDQKPIGFLTEKKLIEVQSTNSAAYLAELINAETIEQLRICYRRLIPAVRTLVLSGSKAEYILSVIKRTSEIITEKVIKKGFIKLGPAPCRFTFLVMGSDGRGEQTLLTDQDNAIIFEDSDPEKVEKCRSYFLKLGKFISDSLNYIGYKYCSGNVMASNPKWVRTESEWRQQIFEWFGGESEDRMLEINILFDFKYAYGEKDFSRRLRQVIWQAADGYPGFLREIALAVSVFKPPMTILGRIQVKHDTNDDEFFDIKKALGPLTIYTRTLALREKIEAVSTIERLHLLNRKGVITDVQCKNYIQAFDYLTQLRFRSQVQSADKNEQMQNYIFIKDLSEIEIITIRRIFKQITSAQNRLRMLLTGSMR